MMECQLSCTLGGHSSWVVLQNSVEVIHGWGNCKHVRSQHMEVVGDAVMNCFGRQKKRIKNYIDS
jgi:hypothetical protein